MKTYRHFFAWIVYSNLFIALCATALTVETFVLLQLPASLNWYILLTFLATIFIYNLHYYQKITADRETDRLQWGLQHRKLQYWLTLLSLLFVLGGIAVHYKNIFLESGQFNLRNLVWFILMPVIAIAYSHPVMPWKRTTLRQIGWLKMASLSFVWSFATTILPVLMQPESGNSTNYLPVFCLFVHRFLFIGALSVLFNIRDYEEDKAANIKTIAVLSGPQRTLLYGKWISTALYVISAIWVVRLFSLDNLVLYIALALPAAFLFLLYQFFKPSQEEASFVILNDGLMLLKALLLIFAVLLLS